VEWRRLRWTVLVYVLGRHGMSAWKNTKGTEDIGIANEA
jgi:hypothetical protein